ncbi:hypothetical protein IWX63_000994 [Arthrobacter sp. CAN_A2]
MTEHNEGRVREDPTAGEGDATGEGPNGGRGRPSAHHEGEE